MNRSSLAVLLVASLACATAHPSDPPGPRTPAAAVSQFLAAVKAKDTKSMGQYWGNERGPWPTTPHRDSLLTVFQIYLRHDGYRIVDGPSETTGRANVLTYHVELQAPGCTRVQPLDVVHAKNGDWLVLDVHLEAEAHVIPHCPLGTREP